MDNDEKAFIPRELRPDLSFPEDAEPPLAPDASHAELRRCAGGVLGSWLRDRLGMSDPDAAPLSPERICRRNPDVAWTAVDGEAVLLDLASGYYFSLNGVGTAIWEWLDGERTLGDVHQAMCRRYEVGTDTAWEDLAALVHRLNADKLVTVE